MAADKQLFAPVPLRTMAMDLSGLQIRVLICLAAHDRMSLVTGKGQGCRASNERMVAMIGCNYSRLCSTLTQLVDLELIAREKLGRHTIYRVIYTNDDRLLFGNMSGRSIGCRPASDDHAIGCRDFPESDSFPPENCSQYIPLNGGIDSVETGEDNSSEDAHLAVRGKGKGAYGSKNSRLKAGLSRTEFADNAGGQMARLERAISVGEAINCSAWSEWLENQIGADDNPANNGRAARLADIVVDRMDDAEYRKWGEDHGWVDEDGVWHAAHPREAS